MITPHHLSHVMCHMYLVMVTCHVSHVMCQVSHIFFYKVVELVGGGCVINGAYPVYFYDIK